MLLPNPSCKVRMRIVLDRGQVAIVQVSSSPTRASGLMSVEEKEALSRDIKLENLDRGTSRG